MAYGFSETHDTLSLEQRVLILEKRVDSLQTYLIRVKQKKDDDNIFTTAKYLEWGRGVTIELKALSMYSGLEAGYTFLTIRHYRMGVFGGTDFIFDFSKPVPELAFYAKTSLGTPVFLNFISISSYFKTLYFVPRAIFGVDGPHSNLKSGNQSNAGIGAGVDFDFWISSHMCVSAGICQTSGAFSFESQGISVKYAFGKIGKK
jgi:hypothetical protein